MDKYTVSVVRVARGYADFEVSASSTEEAQEVAVELAADAHFTKFHSPDATCNYEVSQVSKSGPKTIVIINGVEQRDCLACLALEVRASSSPALRSCDGSIHSEDPRVRGAA